MAERSVNHRDRSAAVNNSRALIDQELRLESNPGGMPAPGRGTLMFVLNGARFFLSHRLPLAQAAIAAGFRVHVVSDVEDESEAREVQKHGIVFHRISLARSGLNPLSEINTVGVLWRVLRRV